MFDINEFNSAIGLSSIFLIFLILHVLFKSRLSSFFDPLNYHLFWVASHFAFFVMYIEKYDINIFIILFSFVFFGYLVFLYIFLRPVSARKVSFCTDSNGRILAVMVFSFCIFLFTQQGFYEFTMVNPVYEWPAYRYVQLQGRDPLLRILSLGIVPVFLFCGLYLFVILRHYRAIVTIFFSIYLAILLCSGGRSSLIGFVFSVGLFCYFYYPLLSKKSMASFSRFGAVFVCVGVAFAISISSLFMNLSFSDGVGVIFNRFFANADGLLYYIQYDGYDKLDSGLGAFLMSFLGIYLKNLAGIDYVNVGQQLTELVVGSVDFAQGANYTIVLQIMILGVPWTISYVLLISWLVAKMRNSSPPVTEKSSQSLIVHIAYFLIVSLSFSIVSDLEYAFLRVISVVFVFVFILLPFYLLLRRIKA